MSTEADFEAFLASVKNLYDDMSKDDRIHLRVTGKSGDVVIAFERYLRDIGKNEPEAEMGHVMDAVCSLLSTVVTSFATIASDNRQDENMFRALVVQSFTQSMKNILEPDHSTVSIFNVTGQAN